MGAPSDMLTILVKNHPDVLMTELSDHGSALSALTIDEENESVADSTEIETPLPNERRAKQAAELNMLKEVLMKTEREKEALSAFVQTLESKNTALNLKMA